MENASTARYRVLVVATHVTQYGSPLFRALGTHPRLDLEVAYCSLQGAEPGLDPDFGQVVQWDVPLLDGYRWTEVPNRARRRGLGRFLGLVNTGLWGMIRKGRYDAVVVYTGYRYASFWIAVGAAKLAGSAVLFGTDASSLGSRSAQGFRWKTQLKRLLWPCLFRLADVVMTPSTAGENLLASIGVRRERIALTPYVVDNEWWTRKAAAVDRALKRQDLGIPMNAVVFLFCGKLQPWKRPQDALRGFARGGDANAYLCFAGDGALRPALEREANQLQVRERVRFLGFQNQSQLPELYVAADVLLFPSEYEPFGVVVNEAMLCGCVPAVSDRVGARLDLVRNDCGFLFRCGDVSGLAEIIRSACSDGEALARMKFVGRDRMTTWSARENVEAVVAAVSRARSLDRSREHS